MVSDYVKMFKPAKLNGNPGVWEWAQLRMVNKPASEVRVPSAPYLNLSWCPCVCQLIYVSACQAVWGPSS